MGAWGAGSFENDDAMDWVYELEEEGLEAVTAALKAVAAAKPQAPEPQVRTAFTAQPAQQPSVMSGAQPVMPAGSFESRWSAFR